MSIRSVLIKTGVDLQMTAWLREYGSGIWFTGDFNLQMYLKYNTHVFTFFIQARL